MLDHFSPEDYLSGRCASDQIGQPKPQTLVEQFTPPPPVLVPIIPIDPQQARQHDNSRLEAAIKKQAEIAATGDVAAARALVALTERRAKLLGLDAPKEIALEVSRPRRSVKDYTTAELVQMLAEYARNGAIDVTPTRSEDDQG